MQISSERSGTRDSRMRRKTLARIQSEKTKFEEGGLVEIGGAGYIKGPLHAPRCGISCIYM